MARLNEVLDYKSHTENDGGVLINDLGISDENQLNAVERTNTTARLAVLYLNPLLALGSNMEKFSVEHYLNIHKSS